LPGNFVPLLLLGDYTRTAYDERLSMNRYHYIDDQGNISDALPLAALHKIGLPPATKVLLEGGKQWTTLEQVSQGGPVVLPVTPPVAPTPPPSAAPAATAVPPLVAASPPPAKKGIPKIGKRGWLGVVILFFALLTFFGAEKSAQDLIQTTSDTFGSGRVAVDEALARAAGHSSYSGYLAQQNRQSGAMFSAVSIALIIWGYRRYNSPKSAAPKASTLLAILAISSLALVSCGRKYTEQEMTGVFKCESPPISLHLNADKTSLTDFGDGVRYRGRWIRVSTDGIQVETDAGGTMFYTILSKDRLKSLMDEEALKLGIQGREYNRIK